MSDSKDRLFLNTKQMDGVLAEMAASMARSCGQEFALVGIQSRGVPLAKSLAHHLEKINKKAPKVGIVDINLYRDDLTEVSSQPVIHNTEMGFPIQNLGLILVDDVLYTGRTVLAAIKALIAQGRPKYIKLAALIDRGWRELPIEADFVGRKVETRADEVVKVMCKEKDGKDEVWIKSHFNKRSA